MKAFFQEIHRVMFHPSHLDTFFYLFLWGLVIVGVPMLVIGLLIALVIAILL